MTDRNKSRIEVGVLALVFGLGGGWAAFEMRLGDLETKVDRIDERVAEMYCASVPVTQRAGCR